MNFETSNRTPISLVGIVNRTDSACDSFTENRGPESCDSTSATVNTDINCRLWQAGRYAELRRRLTDDLIDAEFAGDWQSLQAISNNLACVYRAMGDHDSASQFQLQAATRERNVSATSDLSSTTLANLACDALLAGDVQLAEGLFWKSLLAELAAGDDSAAGSDWANLGLIAGLQGDLVACRQRLWEALKRHRRAGDLLGIAMDLWHLGQSFDVTGDWSLCRRLFERAEHLFAQIQHDALRIEARTQKELASARERVSTFDVARN